MFKLKDILQLFVYPREDRQISCLPSLTCVGSFNIGIQVYRRNIFYVFNVVCFSRYKLKCHVTGYLNFLDILKQFFVDSLFKKPPMKFKVWESKLCDRLNSWYKAIEKDGQVFVSVQITILTSVFDAFF